jgi:hypothetical protein
MNEKLIFYIVDRFGIAGGFVIIGATIGAVATIVTALIIVCGWKIVTRTALGIRRLKVRVHYRRILRRAKNGT